MLFPILAAAVALLVPYLYKKLQYKRLQQYARFPQLPPSAVLGHLQLVDEYVKRSPPNAHPDVAFTAMIEALGRPPVMFVDLRPIATPMLVVGSYHVAEQIVKPSSRFPYSPSKEPHVWEHMVHVSGPTSIMSSSGEDWKALRKRFNPGFAHQHLMELLPSIVERVSVFMDRLDKFAQTGESFSLQSAATDLTFDVIGKVALDVDMGTQTSQPTEFIRELRALIDTYTSEQIDLPHWCTPRLEWKRRRLVKKVRAFLKEFIQRSYDQRSTNSSSRSILSMSLQGIETLTPSTLDVTCDQLSSFLFAGHDTTSTTLAWMFYELSRTPRALCAVREELDGLFGPETTAEAIAARLLGPDGKELIQRMIYATAVIKETLRLWPPGATARLTKPGDGLKATMNLNNGVEDVDLDGLMLYHIHSIIQTDPNVYRETAKIFVPERWLEPDAADKIPPGAWRAFERGPRNCIGQELALIETRVVLAMAVRRYNFLKVGIGAPRSSNATGEGELDDHGRYKIESEMYMTRQVTAKPVDGMVMRVSLA